MTKYLVLPMLAVLGSTVLLSFFSLTSSSAETYNHTEEYMQQHDGGDRAEYLQEMEHNDPLFYVLPVNGTSPSSTTDSNILAN
jgi:hypothetical protein